NTQNAFVVVYVTKYGTVLVPFRIILWGIHKTFGIMRVVQFPTGYGCTCYSVIKVVCSLSQCQASHIAAVTVSSDQQFILSHPRLALEPFGSRYVVDHFPMT